MEKITCICVMRELMMALSNLESSLEETQGVSLNEAMVLCAIGDECITASIIAERTGLRPSHTSKVISSLEENNLLIRQLGKQDKRQIYLSLTEEGMNRLMQIKKQSFDIPSILKPVFDAYQQ